MPGLGRGPPAPGEPPGRGPAGRGGIWDCPDGEPPGRGAPGRGAGWPPPTPNGLLATLGPPGRGAPGRGAGDGAAGRARPGSDTGAGAAVAAAAIGVGAAAGAGACEAAGGGEVTGATSAAGRETGLGADAGAVFLGWDWVEIGNASRSRRATGASTVDDALLTNSPSSLSFARTSLLGTPSSFASSCTRALPATGLLRRRTGGQPARSRFRWETQSWLALHRVLIALLLTIAAYSVSGSWRRAIPTRSTGL